LKTLLSTIGMALCTTVLLIADSTEVWAQRLGSQSVGTSPLRRTLADRTIGGGTDGETPGTAIKGDERFVRGNRRAGDFVGADSGDQTGFVGSEQASTTGRAVSAVSGLRVETGPDADSTQPTTIQERVGMYPPRLAVDFSFVRPTIPRLNSNLQHQLIASLESRFRASRIEVSVEDRTATLRGEVASTRDRTLARLLALFEPGIDVVQNELTVKPMNQPQTNGIPVTERPAVAPAVGSNGWTGQEAATAVPTGRSVPSGRDARSVDR